MSRKWVLVSGSIALLLLVVGVTTWSVLPAGGLTPPEVSTDSDADASPVVLARGSIEEDSAGIGEPVRFHLTVTNRSAAQQISDLAVVQAGARDIVLQPAAWCAASPGATPSRARPCVIAPTLAPGQSVSVSATLAASRPARGVLTLTLAWVDTQDIAGTPQSIASESVVVLGGLVAAPQWARFTATLFSSMPTWLMPAILAVFGYLVQQRLAERDSREKEQAAKSEAWRTMLPISHDYAVRLYSPLISAADHFVQNAAEARRLRRASSTPAVSADERAAIDSAFYGWLKYCVALKTLPNGVYYFKNHVGELVVAGLAIAVVRHFRDQAAPAIGAVTGTQQISRRTIDTAVAETDAHDKAHVVKDRLAFQRVTGHGATLEMLTWFEQRLALTHDPLVEEALAYMRVYSIVLSFEMNRPYAQWFDEPAVLPLKKAQILTIKKMIRLVGEGDQEIEGIGGKLTAYLLEAGVPAAEVAGT